MSPDTRFGRTGLAEPGDAFPADAAAAMSGEPTSLPGAAAANPAESRPHDHRVEGSARRNFFGRRPVLSALLIVGATSLAAGTAYYVTRRIAARVAEPAFELLWRHAAIELRDYAPMTVAETVKPGYHETARRSGFETLADYIFGRNRDGGKIPMTAPVLQQLSDEAGWAKGWAIRFVMPRGSTPGTLPVPASPDVQLKEMPARRVAALRFSGRFSASLAAKKLVALYDHLGNENLQQKGDPEYAFYDPPWTPAPLRRNEILIEVER